MIYRMGLRILPCGVPAGIDLISELVYIILQDNVIRSVIILLVITCLVPGSFGGPDKGQCCVCVYACACMCVEPMVEVRGSVQI